jgi:hypothetical protein
LDKQIKQELVRQLEESWPDALTRLENLFDADARLREICTEYEDVIRCRRSLSQQTERDLGKFDEYTALLRELETELLSIFSEHRSP